MDPLYHVLKGGENASPLARNSKWLAKREEIKNTTMKFEKGFSRLKPVFFDFCFALKKGFQGISLQIPNRIQICALTTLITVQKELKHNLTTS